MKDFSIIVKGAGITFIGFLASKVFGYIYSILLARTLGPELLGIFSIALGVLGFSIMFANLGLPYAISRYIAFYRSKGEEEKVKGTLVSGILINIVSSAFFATLLYLSADFIGITIYNQPLLADILRIFAFIVPLGTIVTSLLLAMEGFKKIKYKIYIRNFIENISKIVLYGAFFLLGFTLMGAALSLLLSYAISLIISFYFVQKKVYPFVRTKVKADYDFRKLFNFSWPLLAASFFAFMLTSIDSFMLGYFIDTASVGVYSVAETIARLQLLAYNSLVVLFLPIVTGYFALGKKQEMKQAFQLITRWIFSLSLPPLLFFFIFAPQIIVAFYGQEYASGFMALSILALGFFVIAAVGPTQSMLRAVGKTKYDLINTVIAGTTNIALNWILIPVYGIVGAATATAASYALWNLLSLVEVFFETGMHPYNLNYVKSIAAGIIATAPLFIVSGLFNFDSLPLLVGLGLAYMALYLLILLLLKGFEKEDFELLLLFEKKIGIQLGFLNSFVERFI